MSKASCHDWHIAEREYHRQIERRGRKHAYERIDPRRTALVVIDMVPFFAEANRYCLATVPNINRVTDGLRTAGGVVAWIVPSNDAPHAEMRIEFYGAEAAETYRASGGSGPIAGRLISALDARPSDLLLEKTAASAFFPGRCDLAKRLLAAGIDTVAIAGTVTNVCVESSARDASTLGFRTIVLADATSCRDDQMHNASLTTIYRSFGDVRAADEMLALIAAGI